MKQAQGKAFTRTFDAYHAAWTRCKMEHGDKPPKAAFIRERRPITSLGVYKKPVGVSWKGILRAV